MKQGDGAEHSFFPSFFLRIIFLLVLSFLTFSVPERLENLVKVGQTLPRKHTGIWWSAGAVEESEFVVPPMRMTREESPTKLKNLLYAMSPESIVEAAITRNRN